MTLIELMVTIAVLALLLRFAVPAFGTMIQNRQIRTAAEAIQDGLQLARTEAVRRNRTVKFEMQTGSGWLVGCETEDTTLGSDGQPNCPASIQTRVQQEGSKNAAVETVQVVVASSTASPSSGTLAFTGLGRVTTGSLPAANNAVYRITNPTGGTCAADGGEMRCLSVVVSPGGQIRMCDPAVSTSGDPRKC